MFFKKKNKYYITKLGHVYNLCDEHKLKDSCGHIIFESNNYKEALCFYNIIAELKENADSLVKFIETHDKEVYNKIDNIDKIINPKLSNAGNVVISPMLAPTYSSVIEDIKNELDDPDTIYAVQGHFPNLVISKYKKELEDSFNYCLRCESGNLALLPKDICFHKKADAIEYQNKIIQKAINEQQK